MRGELFCPKCSQTLAEVGKFWVCPEHGPALSDQPAGSLRIFLSYGFDSNQELVRLIKSDLEKRGHDVWFDKSEIKFGDDWRREITDGIQGSNKFLAFLSKHSTRDPGVCRDEIAIALGVKGGNIQTVLVESEAEVQPPVNISHVQWLDMYDWKTKKAAGDPSWTDWYQSKLAEIIRVVESDESRRFAGEIETLNNHLKPIKSDARIFDLLKKGFFGRAWLFDAVEQWRCPKSEIVTRKSEIPPSRLFWITGDPGVGKSAFAAQLTHTRSDAVIAAQFVEWDKPDHRDARRVVRSLAFQLATRLPDYRKLLLTLPEIGELDRKDPAELFDYLLANPLRSVIGGGRERQLIVIDALDEAGEAGRNPLVEMLARHAPRLPDWLGLVVTSRPESAVQTPLQGLNPFALDTRTEANRADLRDYLRQKLAPQVHDRPDADRLLGQILDKSEGVFLYVERFCDDVQQNHLSLDRPEQFPQGLGGIFCQWFQRQFPDLEKFRQAVRPALRAILAAREPLPVEILQRLFHWPDEELRDFIRTLGSLFPVTKEANGEVIKPYHKSLADWLGDQHSAGGFFIARCEGHRMLAKEYCKMVAAAGSGDRAANKSLTSRAAFHLAHSESWKDFQHWVKEHTGNLLNAWDDGGLVDEGLSTLEFALQSREFKSLDAGLYGSLATQAGRILGRLGDFKRAEDCLALRALKDCSPNLHRSVRAIAVHELSSLDLYHGRFRQAALGYRKALWLASSVLPPRLDEVAANCIGLATVYQNLCRFRSAAVLSRIGGGLAILLHDSRHAAAALSVQGLASKALGHSAAARKTFLAGLRFAARANSGMERSRLLICLGWLALDRAVIDGKEPGEEAPKFFQEAWELARHLKDPFHEADAHLGCIWSALANHDLRQAKERACSLVQLFHGALPEYLELGYAAVQGAIGIASGEFATASERFTSILNRPSDSNSGFLWKSVALVGAGSLAWHSERRHDAEALWNQARFTARSHSPFRAQVANAAIDLCVASSTQPPL